MTSESPQNDSGTPNVKQPTPAASTPPNVNNADTTPAGPQGQPFAFYPGQDAATNGDVPHDTTAESGGGINGPLPYPVYPYGNVLPAPPMTRPKRTQCKNACTNCQKACKKCDDNRPCHRCIRYGTTETCVDSKRKERKKGVKRGPYKKRDSKGNNAEDEDEDGSGAGSVNGVHGPTSSMPYVGPVGYPPGMWSSYSPGGPIGKLEGGGYYQPVFALTPVSGQPHSDGENPGGPGSEPPHFPVGFYPATFISYPGPYPPYGLPQGQGSPPHGFHYAYPPPPGMFPPPRPPQVSAGTTNSEHTAAAPGSSTAKDAPDIGPNTGKSGEKENVAEPQLNGKAKTNTKVEAQMNGVSKDAN